MRHLVFGTACCLAIGLGFGWAAWGQATATGPGATTKAELLVVTLPGDVKNSQEQLTKWVNGFLAKTEAEVLQILGNSVERSRDSDGDLVLKYKTSERGSLNLYFSSRGRVILASYGVMSD